MQQPFSAGETSLARQLRQYQSNDARYDELWDPQSQSIRPHWQSLFNSLQDLPDGDLRVRQQLIHKQRQEIGLTYEHVGAERGEAWGLDPIPLVTCEADWEQVRLGMEQRAKLLNLVLRDLYGERSLISSGLLPAQLIQGNSHFYRPCDQLFPLHNPALFLYAADIARGPDGTLKILRDKTQMPTGAGYCLENRVALAKVMTDEFSQNQIARLSSFFKVWNRSLKALVPHKDDPTIVVLSGGSHTEGYFEHAYIAAYLGYNLVLGDDLTVREGKVWLKTLEGLQQVDVILRWLEDDLCDSLELNETSISGVPGLLHAARAGNVVVVNPIGSAIMESPGLMPFLPKIAEHLLGEPLILPQAESHWCGQPSSLDWVLANISHWVIKRVDSPRNNFYPTAMEPDALAQLTQQMRAQPERFMAQELLQFSSAPSWTSGRMQSLPIKMRSFAVQDQQGYQVLPGALSRIVNPEDHATEPREYGGWCKDTWVFTDNPEQYLSLWQQVQASAVYAGSEQITSRSAESLYWVGRNIERAESTVRLIRTLLIRLSEYFPSQQDATLEHIQKLTLGLCQHYPQLQEEFAGATGSGRSGYWRVIRKFVFGTELDGGLSATFAYFINSAFMVRDYWSGDTWRIIDEINQAAERIKHSKSTRSVSDIQDLLNELVDATSAFSGHAVESLSRDGGWSMLEIGRRLERGAQLTNLMEILLQNQQEQELQSQILDSLLYSQESLTTHRRRFRVTQQLETVLELLLLSADYPRSLHYQLSQLQQLCQRLPNQQTGSQLPPHERSILSALSALQLTDLKDLAAVDDSQQERQVLVTLMQQIQGDLQQFSDALGQRYFSHTKGARQLLQGQLSP